MPKISISLNGPLIITKSPLSGLLASKHSLRANNLSTTKKSKQPVYGLSSASDSIQRKFMTPEDDTAIQKDRCTPPPLLPHTRARARAHTHTHTTHAFKIFVQYKITQRQHWTKLPLRYWQSRRIRIVEDAALNTHGSIWESTGSMVCLFMFYLTMLSVASTTQLRILEW